MEEKKSKGFSDIFKDILHSPAVLVTVIVGVLAVGYIIIKSNSANNATQAGAPGSQAGASPNGPGYYLQEQDIIEPAPSVTITTNNPAPLPAPTPTPAPQPAPLDESAVQQWILQQQNASSVIDTIENAYRAAHPAPKPSNKKKNPDNKAR